MGVSWGRTVSREVLQRAHHHTQLAGHRGRNALGGGGRLGAEHSPRDERLGIARDIRDDAEVHGDARFGECRRACGECLLRCRHRGVTEFAGTRGAVPWQALHVAALLVDGDEDGRLGIRLHAGRQGSDLRRGSRDVVPHEDESRDPGVDVRAKGSRIRAGRVEHEHGGGLLLEGEVGHVPACPVQGRVGPGRRSGRGRRRRAG